MKSTAKCVVDGRRHKSDGELFEYERNSDQHLLLRDYEDALDVQSACNLSGVVYSFSRVMERLCKESSSQKQGSDWRNEHPICRLYAEQIAFLTGGGACSDSERYHHAFDYVVSVVNAEKAGL